MFSKNTDVIIAEPKKNYSKKEINILDKILEFNGDIATSSEEGIKLKIYLQQLILLELTHSQIILMIYKLS